MVVFRILRAELCSFQLEYAIKQSAEAKPMNRWFPVQVLFCCVYIGQISYHGTFFEKDIIQVVN